MEELSAVKYIEKRSRFFAHLYKIEGSRNIDQALKDHRRKYKKAVHHCFAARFTENKELKEVSKDDGEVGHPGKVLLDLLRREGLESHMVVVSRIFGGVKLGVGGVSRAFRSAGEGVIPRTE